MKKYLHSVVVFGLFLVIPSTIESQSKKAGAPFQPVADSLTAGTRQSFIFKSPANPEITVFYALPPKITRQTRFLMVMAGRQRDADVYLDSWIEWGSKNDYVVVAPQFDQENWSEGLGYGFGNIASGTENKNKPNPKSKWAFTVVEELFAKIKHTYSLSVSDYVLFGHSGGGQFVNRFMLFNPRNHVRLAIAANPGFYTLPDLSLEFPYGLKDSPAPISKKQLLDWTNCNLILMRGTADIKRTDSLRQTAEADEQGKTRFERAAFMYSKVKAVNPNTKWKLIDVPDIAHDQKGMALAAQKVLEQ